MVDSTSQERQDGRIRDHERIADLQAIEDLAGQCLIGLGG